jgi:hypothetical protein
LRVPSDPSVPALGSYASVIWGLATQHLKEARKLAGLAVAAALTVMEFRASYWHRMRDRANVLSETLGYQGFAASSRWNPLTTSGAGFYLHVAITLPWVATLFIRVDST